VGTNGQVLTSNGTSITWATASGGGSGVPYAGATSAVDLGLYDLTVNRVTIGRGAGNVSTNTAIGYQSLVFNTSGSSNTASGYQSLFSNTSGFQNTANGVQSLFYNTTGSYNTASGYQSLYSNLSGGQNTANGGESLKNNTTGHHNTANGRYSLYSNTTGTNNTANGSNALYFNTTGSNNTANGYQAGKFISNGSSNTTSGYSVYLGTDTKTSADNAQNEVVIGYNAIGAGSNTVQLGNTSVTNVKTSGTITADAVTYPKAHGTSGQVLSTNGSGTLTWATPSTTATAYSGTLPVANGGTGLTTVGTNGQVLTSNGTSITWATPASSSSSSPTYTTGLNSDLGGYVFFLSTDSKHGLVAETQDQSTPTTWYDAEDKISNQANHSTNGKKFTDWRLPTKHELNLMYSVKNSIGGFASNFYWSSTEGDSTSAWYHYFGDNSQNSTSKFNSFYVRAVRAF
jgi:hypothetical protein